MLKSEGYIRDYSVAEFGNGRTEFQVELKVLRRRAGHQDHRARVEAGAAASTCPYDTMPRFADGLGTVILSTSRGVMADHEAREARVGGEVLCRVF